MRRSFLHDWLKADLTCALVPPLYRWQFRRALNAMQRCRVEEAACRPAEREADVPSILSKYLLALYAASRWIMRTAFRLQSPTCHRHSARCSVC